MVEQVVGLEFIVTGATEATAAIKRMANSQAQLTGSISKSLGVTQRVENEVRKLAKSYTDGSLNLNQYTKAVSQTANAYGVFIGNNKRARSDVAALSTALIAEAKAQKQSTQAKAAAAAAIKAEAQAIKDYRQARREATAANQRYDAEAKAAAAQAKQAAAADAALAREKDRLIQKLNPLRSASMLYEKELRDINEATRLGAINDRQRQQSLDALNAEFQAFSTGAQGAAMANNRFGVQSQMAARKTNQLGVLMQQTGYQVGDFAVQVQGGTNVMVALGQQATQLVGTFGMLAKSTRMIGVFAGLGILIPIVTGVAAAFMRMKEGADAAAKSADDFEDKLRSARSELQGMVDDLRLLQSGLESAFVLTLSDEVDRAKDALAEARSELDALYAADVAIGESLANVTNLDDYQESVRLARERLLTATIELSTAQELSRQEKQRERDASVANQLYEARQILAEQLKDNQDALTEGAKSLLGVWSAITGRVKESASEIANATKALDEMRIEFSFRGRSMAQYGGRGTTSDTPISGDIPEEPTVMRPSGSGASNVVDINAILDARRQQIEQERVLLGLSGQQREAQAIYFDLLKQNEEAVNRLSDTELMRAANVLAAEQEKNRVIEEGLKRQQDISNLFESSMERTFMSIVDGTATVEDAFRSMASEIIKELYRVLVVQQLVGSVSGGTGIAGFIGGFFANGAAFSNGNVVPFANGGVVGSPTTFPMAGGKTGLMGEAGPEAIMPLKRGKDGKLGVAADGGGAVTVNNYFTVQANGDDSVKRIVRQQIPQIAEATKAAVVDAKRRGGSYGRAFA